MNPLVQLNLALILFAPWYAILGYVFWRFPAAPRHGRRRAFDLAALATAAVATATSLYWSHDAAGTAHGEMWRQVLATSVSYGVFLAVLTTAFFVRRRVFAGAAAPLSPSGATP